MIAEEEARVKRLQEEAEQQAREEEARLDAEQKAIEEEKERKRKQKQDKVDAQKAAGTYMTKAEKEKAKKAQARLESMKKAGLISVDPGTGAVKPAGGNSVASKIPAADVEPAVKDAATVAVALPPPPPPAAAIAAEEEEAGAAEQEDWDLDDDWEANIEKITSKVESLKEKVSEDVEDMLMVDEKKSHERLKQLGLDRAKREEEARVKR